VSNVGLLYVGAVLFINGLMLIGKVPGKSAAIINFFVGTMQVVFPTIIIAQSGGDPATILGASGLYLFGFTYLYVALNQMFGLPGEGLGWFSLFVAACAVTYGAISFTVSNDPVFGVVWIIWAVLWFLFFLLLALGKDSLTETTGWFTIIVAHLTATIPALLLLSGTFVSTPANAVVMAVGGIAALAIAWFLGRRASVQRESAAAAHA
jgi:hypothetical protein